MATAGYQAQIKSATCIASSWSHACTHKPKHTYLHQDKRLQGCVTCWSNKLRYDRALLRTPQFFGRHWFSPHAMLTSASSSFCCDTAVGVKHGVVRLVALDWSRCWCCEGRHRKSSRRYGRKWVKHRVYGDCKYLSSCGPAACW